MSSKAHTLVRIIVVGDSYVGKTRLLRQFVDGEARDEHETVRVSLYCIVSCLYLYLCLYCVCIMFVCIVCALSMRYEIQLRLCVCWLACPW